jgi:hypothetical protein
MNDTPATPEAPAVPATPADAAATVTEAAGLCYLDPARVRFTRAGARIDVRVGDRPPVANVSVLRAFPLSEPDRYLSVRNEKNEELGLIVEPERLDPDSRAIIAAELQRRYVTPVIRRIVSIRERFEIIECQVETDRGLCQFSARNLRESVIRPGPGRYILTDVDGNRFDLPDLQALPPASQAQLLAHL